MSTLGSDLNFPFLTLDWKSWVLKLNNSVSRFWLSVMSHWNLLRVVDLKSGGLSSQHWVDGGYLSCRRCHGEELSAEFLLTVTGNIQGKRSSHTLV